MDDLEISVVQELKELLPGLDLNLWTIRKIRTHLEEKLKTDLTPKKQFVKEQINKILDESANEIQQSIIESQSQQDNSAKGKRQQPDGEEEVPGPKGTMTDDSNMSVELQTLIGVSGILQRREIVKKLWEHIKGNELQDPKDKRQILVEGPMASVFQAPLTAFNLNKQLKNHVKSADPSTKRRKTEGGGGGGGFMAPLRLSDDLASFMGKEEATRAEITKSMWAYFKGKELLNPSDKREVICDDTLQNLLGVKRLKAFSIQKYIKKHVGPITADE